TSITIPNSVTSIDNGAFGDCTGLTSVTIGNSVTSIAQEAFENCSSLTSIIIPDSVTRIEWYAFYGCSSLTSITIPDSVTSIGGYAFSDCSGLTSIYYSGTSEQWNGVIKVSDWKKNSPAVVYVFGTTTATSSKTYVSGSADGGGATGFAAELEADTVDLSNVVWTVTSGGEKRRAAGLSYGGTVTGPVQIGLIVAGLYDENATAEAAYGNKEYVEYTE
ncbi:MAG: leucine-rich repeat domain-containing protein, partial [Clostridia bacterium]|nr:leucine-rich repeat domain-containing protein [Clostridia bacterium]